MGHRLLFVAPVGERRTVSYNIQISAELLKMWFEPVDSLPTYVVASQP